MSSTQLRKAAAILIAAAGALLAPSAALAVPAPDGYYDAGGTSSRWYALYWNDAFVSEVHLKGCANRIPVAQTPQSDGSVKATAPGPAKPGPCVVALGLNLSSPFRSALSSALKGAGPNPAPFAIAEVSGGRLASEVSGTGYISDVTIGDALIEVELVPSSGKLKRTSAPNRSIGPAGIDAVTNTALTLDGKPLEADATLRPLAWKRSEQSGGSSTLPGALDLTAPIVGIPSASGAVATVDAWSAAAVAGSITYKPLGAVYRSAGGRTLTVRLDTFPARWDPFPTSGRRMLELGAGATVLELS